MSNLIAKEYQGFEQIKHTDDAGNEYWLARELAAVLEYVQWRNFNNVLDRAMLACRNSGFNIDDHFFEVSKMVEMPIKPQKIGFADLNKTKTKSIIEYKLSRYACYLIVQNGDPRKEIIAIGQTYFAIQTRRQEVADERVGGVLPENQPTPSKSIEEIQKEQLKKLKSLKKLMLDE
jgi:DNA-damage-inducible protein D